MDMMARNLRQWNDRTLLAWLPLVMLAGSFILYLVLRSHVLHMEEQQLRLKADNVWQAYVDAKGSLPSSISGEYEIRKLADGSGFTTRGPIDTTFGLPVSGEREFAGLATLKKSADGDYQVFTFVSSRELGHLMVKIALTEALIFLMLLIAVLVANKNMAARIWRPFITTIAKLRAYDIRKGEPPVMEMETGVEEFNHLNGTLRDLFDQVERAYQNQKQFTENAAHELQTPLAVIRAKAELLADAAPLNEESARLLSDIMEANDRMSQMNKDLLLLASIENQQFKADEEVDLSAALERLLDMHMHLQEHSGIKVESDIHKGIKVLANAHLVDVLLNNLLRNAFVHNIPSGWISVQLHGFALDIRNSGPALAADPMQMFERFHKGDQRSGTTGLGLSLVKQICQAHQFKFAYTATGGEHQLQVEFGPSAS